MPDSASLLTFVIAAFVIAVVPGPVVTVIVASSLSRGTRAGLGIIAGTQVAGATMILVVAAGLEAIVAVMGQAFDWIKLIGAAYLVWLGINMVRASGRLESAGPARARRFGGYVVQGFLVNWANPKSLFFFGAFLPQFVDLSAPAFPQILLLGVLFLVVAGLTDSFYAVLAGRARHLVTAPRVRLLNRVSGTLLIAGGTWMALQRRAA